jgi:hypothetical protein
MRAMVGCTSSSGLPFLSRSFAHDDPRLQIISHTTTSSSNTEERVQQLLQLQLAQRQEVATVSSALQVLPKMPLFSEKL